MTKDENVLMSNEMFVDYKVLTSRADINYFNPTVRSEEGLPIGNGRMGSLVWTSNNKLNLQINRVDAFAQDAYSESGTDYCGGCGKIEVDFRNPVFKPNKNFNEHLSVSDGLVTVLGNSIRVRAFAWSEDDVIGIHIDDKRKDPPPINVELGMLRPSADRKKKYHWVTSTFHQKNNKVFLVQEFSEKKFFCRSIVGISIIGQQIDRKGTENFTRFSRILRLVVKPGTGSFTILISSSVSFDKDKDIISEAMSKLNTASKRGFENMLSESRVWWDSFWRKSFLHLHSPDGVADFLERCYTYHMYLMASSSRGKFPPKFNGMLWSTNGDEREWGARYWLANTEVMYYPLFTANHLELTNPYFNMYSEMLDKAKIAARQRWGSKGIFIPELVAFNGPEVLPKEIANTFKTILLGELPYDKMSESFRDFGNSRSQFSHLGNIFLSGQRWSWVAEIVSGAAELSTQYWERYKLTGDEGWLQEKAYPILKETVEFYRNFPNVRKELDGLYHIHDTNAHESVWGVQDSILDLAAIRVITSLAIHASKILGTDANLRLKWQEFLHNLAPYPIDSETNTWVAGCEPAATDLSKGKRTPFAFVCLAPIFPFKGWTLETKNKDINKIAETTYQSLPGRKLLLAEGKGGSVQDRLGIIAARMGKSEDIKILLPALITSISESILPNGLSLAEGKQAMTCEHTGVLSYALQEALLQSIPSDPGENSIIHLYPAWPESWDSQFSLLAHGGFMVTSEFKKGKAQFIGIKSFLGNKCLMQNPWSNQVDIYRNSKYDKELSGEFLEFVTTKDENVLIVPRGDDITHLKRKAIPILPGTGIWELNIKIGDIESHVIVGKH